MTASRVGMTVGSTTRNGGEFEFKKISLSLERDLAPAENPVDAYRDIKALLERMVSEFQGSSKSAGTSSSAGNGNRADSPRPAASKPPSLTVETVRERVAKWLPDLEIVDGFDGFSVKPKRYLDQSWRDVNEVVRSLGGKWQKGQMSRDGRPQSKVARARSPSSRRSQNIRVLCVLRYGTGGTYSRGQSGVHSTPVGTVVSFVFRATEAASRTISVLRITFFEAGQSVHLLEIFPRQLSFQDSGRRI